MGLRSRRRVGVWDAVNSGVLGGGSRGFGAAHKSRSHNDQHAKKQGLVPVAHVSIGSVYIFSHILSDNVLTEPDCCNSCLLSAC